MTDSQPTERIPRDTAVLQPVEPPRRRFPVWPVLVGVLALALLGVTVVLVSVLTNGSPGVVATPEPSAASAGPSPGTTAAPPLPPTTPAEPRPEAGPNECVDALGDGEGVDLDRVVIDADENELAVQFVLAAALPDGDSALGLYTESGNGRNAYQLGIAFVDGRVDRFFIWDGEDEDELDADDVTVSGSSITAVFPSDELKRLGGNWGWNGFATAGDVLDACPGTTDESQLLPFER